MQPLRAREYGDDMVVPIRLFQKQLFSNPTLPLSVNSKLDACPSKTSPRSTQTKVDRDQSSQPQRQTQTDFGIASKFTGNFGDTHVQAAGAVDRRRYNSLIEESLQLRW